MANSFFSVHCFQLLNLRKGQISFTLLMALLQILW